ncbi:DUF4129 domain-containing protein [Streptomyces sp. MS06]|uniref:DUF4129 domain-containing protein n=1 Tax=Streptomyces sp. MS06 TaxID=3385974 RepID=UPI0039A1E83C
MTPAGGVLAAAPALPHATRTVLRAAAQARAAAAGTLRHLFDAPLLSLARSGDEPPITVGRDPAREAARRELSKRMYHENDPGLLHRAVNAFWDWLDRLLGAASAAAPGGAVGLAVVIVAVVAVLAALWWRLGTPHRTPVSAAALFDDRPRSAADHRATAEAHAAQGHWTQALQERVRAVVRSLEERALLDVRPGRTAVEAAAEAGRALPGHTDALRAAAREFDDVTYGGRSATEESYRRVAALDRDLEGSRPRFAGGNAATTAADRPGAAQ